ncbi:MAG: hypothetical protein M1822_001297 [Bathelium mastoideum]|nr:MAG: hypothetical protein M1822_001297 [Bathelium mastoideum]
MFRVPNPADIDPILQKYATLKQEAKKDGKPYILEVTAGKSIDDPRNQGYTLFALVKFSSIDDMKCASWKAVEFAVVNKEYRYYDTECEAHQALKAVGKGKAEPPPLVVYMSDVVHA